MTGVGCGRQVPEVLSEPGASPGNQGPQTPPGPHAQGEYSSWGGQISNACSSCALGWAHSRAPEPQPRTPAPMPRLGQDQRPCVSAVVLEGSPGLRAGRTARWAAVPGCGGSCAGTPIALSSPRGDVPSHPVLCWAVPPGVQAGEAACPPSRGEPSGRVKTRSEEETQSAAPQPQSLGRSFRPQSPAGQGPLRLEPLCWAPEGHAGPSHTAVTSDFTKLCSRRPLPYTDLSFDQALRGIGNNLEISWQPN